ncbi:MAG TPA: CzcE family metal-binding protein [Burkholderiales bacterium]|nr:CzcE family metal-binding protein [Burkholderiales bacterium]
MKRAFRPLAGTAPFLATTMLYFGTAFALPSDSQGWLGTPVEGSRADRVIRVTPGTRWVNVSENETVRFVVGDQSFAWQFNGSRGVFHLSDIAPAGLVSQPINVYVGADPLEGQPGE